ncbi:MAG TPA: arsenite methyltransferase [Candidatus Aminicenantes bacterium]|nr:arsenite methyltransferase [Candidatus Aminicenantes bacterium]
MKNSEKDGLRQDVRKRYGEIAKQNGSCCGNSGCCSQAPGSAGASAGLGYSGEEISAVPEGADMGLGCGNPQAIAQLRAGEAVLDLGCGGGFDCFLAARRVGESGRVIGVDMTPEMVSKARENARKGQYHNVEIRLGEIEHLPVADACVDVIMSNCVINLSPDKQQVFRDAFRVLRENGRLAVSDIVAVKPLPEKILKDPDALSGCVAGAALVNDVKNMLRDAGFVDVSVEVREDSTRFLRDWFPGSGAEEYVRSAMITARKPIHGDEG